MSKKLHTVLASALILPSAAIAGLDPISDEEMSEVTGQAFLSVDRDYHPDPAQNTAYTRVNLGMDIEIQTNVDVLEVGRYEREGEREGSSDVLINDFALGYILAMSCFERCSFSFHCLTFARFRFTSSFCTLLTKSYCFYCMPYFCHNNM